MFMLLLFSFHTRATMVNILLLRNGRLHAMKWVKVDMIGIEAVFVRDRCWRGSGRDSNILIRSIWAIASVCGLVIVNLWLRGIVPRTAGFCRMVGKMVVQRKIVWRTVWPRGISILETEQIVEEYVNKVAIREGGVLHEKISILILLSIHNGRISRIILSVVIYDYGSVVLRIFDQGLHGACISYR